MDRHNSKAWVMRLAGIELCKSKETAFSLLYSCLFVLEGSHSGSKKKKKPKQQKPVLPLRFGTDWDFRPGSKKQKENELKSGFENSFHAVTRLDSTRQVRWPNILLRAKLRQISDSFSCVVTNEACWCYVANHLSSFTWVLFKIVSWNNGVQNRARHWTHHVI